MLKGVDLGGGRGKLLEKRVKYFFIEKTDFPFDN